MREMDPGHVVAVEDYSPETLRNLIAHLEQSTAFEHFIYRESELDALWRLLEIAAPGRVVLEADERRRVETLLAAARNAHDLVADERPLEAAARLRAVLAEESAASLNPSPTLSPES
jgi:hypothetical protein